MIDTPIEDPGGGLKTLLTLWIVLALARFADRPIRHRVVGRGAKGLQALDAAELLVLAPLHVLGTSSAGLLLLYADQMASIASSSHPERTLHPGRPAAHGQLVGLARIALDLAARQALIRAQMHHLRLHVGVDRICEGESQLLPVKLVPILVLPI